MPVMTRSMTAKIRAAYPVSTLASLPNFEEMAVEEHQPEPLTIHAPVEEDSVEDISDSSSTDSEVPMSGIQRFCRGLRAISGFLQGTVGEDSDDGSVETHDPEMDVEEPKMDVEEDSDDEAVEFRAPYPMYWTGYRIPADECAMAWMWADSGRCCAGLVRNAGQGHRNLATMFRSHASVGAITDFKFEFEKHADMLHFIDMAGPIFREEFAVTGGVTFICHAWDTPSPKIDENARTFKFEIARPLFFRIDVKKEL